MQFRVSEVNAAEISVVLVLYNFSTANMLKTNPQKRSAFACALLYTNMRLMRRT